MGQDCNPLVLSVLLPALTFYCLSEIWNSVTSPYTQFLWALWFRASKSNSMCFITCLSNPGKGKHMSRWNTIKFRLSVDILPRFNLTHKTNHIKVCLNSAGLICYVESLHHLLVLPLLVVVLLLLRAVVYVRLSFSSCLLGLWLPLWRCIPPTGRKRSMPLVHQTCHCCQNTSGE